MPLPAGATHCPNCGTPVTGSMARASEETPYTYFEYAAAPPSSLSASEQPIYAPSAPASSYNQPPSYAQVTRPPRPVMPPPPAPFSVPPPASRPPRRKRRDLMVSLIAIAVLLVLAGSGLLTYNFAVVQPTMRANATATAYVISPQRAYIAATSGKPEIIDSLNGQSVNNFRPNANSTFGGSCAYSSGAFHAIQATSGRFYICPGVSTFSNFALQVQIQVQRGDYGGIGFRLNPATGALYLLTINTDGYFSFNVYKSFGSGYGLNGGYVSNFHTGLNQTNLITLIARGTNFLLYVNKMYAGKVSDTTYSDGNIALLAINHTQYTDVAYTNLQIWNLS